jgi:hypothetical protein
MNTNLLILIHPQENAAAAHQQLGHRNDSECHKIHGYYASMNSIWNALLLA